MSSKRNFGVDEDSEDCADIANNDFLDIFKGDSDSSDILFPARKRCKRLVIEDDTDDQDRINYQLSEKWIWKGKNNFISVWCKQNRIGHF